MLKRKDSRISVDKQFSDQQIWSVAGLRDKSYLYQRICILQVVGPSKRNLSDFSPDTRFPHHGFPSACIFISMWFYVIDYPNRPQSCTASVRRIDLKRAFFCSIDSVWCVWGAEDDSGWMAIPLERETTRSVFTFSSLTTHKNISTLFPASSLNLATSCCPYTKAFGKSLKRLVFAIRQKDVKGLQGGQKPRFKSLRFEFTMKTPERKERTVDRN